MALALQSLARKRGLVSKTEVFGQSQQLTGTAISSGKEQSCKADSTST